MRRQRRFEDNSENILNDVAWETDIWLGLVLCRECATLNAECKGAAEGSPIRPIQCGSVFTRNTI